MRTLAPALVIFVLTSCSTLTKAVKEPKVELDSIGFTDPSLTEATVLLKFAVNNPNRFELKLDKVTYDLNLNSKDLAQGEISEGLKLAPETSTRVDLPVRMKYTEIFGSLTKMAAAGKSPFEFTGKLKAGLIEVPFSKSGEVELPKF